MEQGKAILAEINKARMNPQGCIEDIKAQLSRFDSAFVIKTAKGERLKLNEGKVAWQDAILYLERCKPKDPIVWNTDLAEVCEEYSGYNEKGQQVSPFNLLRSRFQYEGSVSFNINECQVEQTFRELVVSLVVGDGDQKKGNRTTLFNPNFKCFGGYSVKYPKQTATFMFFSDTVNFKPKPQDSASGAESSSGKNKPQFIQQEKQNGESNVSTLEMIEVGKSLFAELNAIRRQPKKIVPLLKTDLGKFIDDKTLQKGSLNIITKQGKTPYQDFISELQQQFPLPLLKISEGLCVAAVRQLLQLQQKSKGQSLTIDNNAYLKKYTIGAQGMNNIVMNRNKDESIVDMLILLMVGDGDRKRGARRKVLSPVLKVGGMAASDNYFVINIGQNCRDNKDQIQRYYSDQSNPQPTKSQPKTSSPKHVSYESKPKQSSYDQQQKSIKKKTTKTTTLTRNGKNYKITKTSITYEDGTTEQVQDQQLI